jgi:hypothetical protein
VRKSDDANLNHPTSVFATSPSHHTSSTYIIIMADTEQRKAKFEPKQPIELAPPKDDVISVEHLARCDGGSSHIAL